MYFLVRDDTSPRGRLSRPLPTAHFKSDIKFFYFSIFLSFLRRILPRENDKRRWTIWPSAQRIYNFAMLRFCALVLVHPRTCMCSLSKFFTICWLAKVLIVGIARPTPQHYSSFVMLRIANTYTKILPRFAYLIWMN